MKCVIENIVVDVSFNQIGGVSTFCFLELVDRQVGKNHLFKRSIMLIKAWCYHESRILGAHHGLISTYALETLVLYIFNMFHKSLHGPLEAFYRFLEYFSKFDWDKYGISLNGPVDLSLLPNLTVEPTAGQDELLFDKEFLQGFFDRLVVIPNESDGCDTQFRQKFLNIIDPLKGNNNLGRSVSKGNFYRIRSAFSFGAQKLGQILMLSPEFIRNEIYGFFENTLKRHGKGERPDIGSSSFQSLLGPENALSEDGSRLKTSCMNEGENRSSLPDKDLSVTDVHKNSGRCQPCVVQDLPWNKIWFMEYASDFCANSTYLSHPSFSCENGNGNSKECFENYATEADLQLVSGLHMSQQIHANQHILTNSTRTNILDFSSSCPVNESDWNAALHADKKPLPPFLLSNMLDVSGDLDLHLGCLRKVQYHLESLFDELLQAVEEACLAGVLDEDSFKIPTMIFKSKSNTGTSLSLASSIDGERRKLSPVYCSHSTGDDSQQPHAEEAQVDVGWQQNLPLCSNGSALSSSPLANLDNYPASWFCVSTKSRGTGTYIPKVNYYSYQDRMALEREIMRERKQRQRVPGRQYYSAEQGYSSSQTEHTTAQRETSQSPKKQTSSQQNGYSSKSSVPSEDFVEFKEHVATVDGGTKQAVGSGSVENGRQTRPPSSSGMVLPHNGQGNPSVSNTCQPSSPASAEGSLEFGSFGPFPLELLSVQFEEAFTAPPTGKRAEEVSSPASKGPAEAPASTAQFEEEFPALPTRKRAEEVPAPASKGPAEAPASRAQFEEAFPALPTRKRAEEVPVPTSKGPAEAPASTVLNTKTVEMENRSQEVYRLRDEADFPPLQAGCR
ncbi:hypothetical protein SETIT_2G432700v2 [Setaria italica]|nr:hypothetical protein SETIT_2G432700v2 [Setaria italica]TKW36518.1 hypothetical protein SEVIR_2G445700v2 [Setaria viridis]